jgi:hypothetical protein
VPAIHLRLQLQQRLAMHPPTPSRDPARRPNPSWAVGAVVPTPGAHEKGASLYATSVGAGLRGAGGGLPWSLEVTPALGGDESSPAVVDLGQIGAIAGENPISSFIAAIARSGNIQTGGLEGGAGTGWRSGGMRRRREWVRHGRRRKFFSRVAPDSYIYSSPVGLLLLVLKFLLI